MPRLHALGMLLRVSACGHWPQTGGGGVAEFATPSAPVPVTDAALAVHLDCSLAKVTVLAQASSRSGMATGQVVQVDLLAARAQREVAGRLPQDAGRTLQLLDTHVAALAPRLLTGADDTTSCAG